MSARSLGPSEARVVLVEYSDFQCPACAQFSPYLKEILQEHGTQIRLEYRHYPLINTHPYAIPAAIAAEAAGVQGKFWEMHDKLFENQNAWSRAANPQPFLCNMPESLVSMSRGSSDTSALHSSPMRSKRVTRRPKAEDCPVRRLFS